MSALDVGFQEVSVRLKLLIRLQRLRCYYIL
jgi:hypothetical protein